MTRFQLKYLNLRAKAEPIRLLLHYVEQPFEDVRENFLEFAKYKDRLEPETDEERATCECLAQRIQDYMNFIRPYINCLLGLIPADKLPTLCERVFVPCITRDYAPTFENQLQKCNTGYLVGDSLTWIDFYAACFSDYAITYARADIFDKFPRVQYHCRAIMSLPQLQDYLKNRGDSLC